MSGDDSDTELTIWYAESKDLPKKLKAPPWEDFNSQGFSPSLDQDDCQIYFMPWLKQVFLYSRSKRTGIFWVNSAEEIAWWEPTFSFRIIFHWWTRDLPAQLIHAGTMALDKDSGWLITGPSGSGKSTSCLNLLKSGARYLGDDYVWAELEPVPVVYALYQTAKVEPDNLHQRFSDWKPYLLNPESYTSQKAILDIKALFPDRWLSCVKLNGILLPKVANTEKTVFSATPASRALIGIAPTTLHHLPHHRDLSYKKISTLSSRLPTYNWLLGTDKSQFIESFNQFVNDGSR